jgi:hypothetical protein
VVGASFGWQDPAPRAPGPADLVAGRGPRGPGSVGRRRLPGPRPLGPNKGGKAMRTASHGSERRKRTPVRPGLRPRPGTPARAMRPAHKSPRRPLGRPAVERGAAARFTRRLSMPTQPTGHAAKPGGRGGPERKRRFFKKLRARCLTRRAGPYQGGSVARTRGNVGRPHGGKGGEA